VPQSAHAWNSVRALAVLWALGACTGQFDFNGLRLVPLDSGVDADPPGAISCGHHGPPHRPAVVARGGALDLVFAAKSADFGNHYDDAGKPKFLSIGFDLDNTCTGEGQGSSCVEPRWATANHDDGVDGIDNSAGRADFGSLNPSVAIATSSTGTLILRVRGYSGEEDDDQDSVSLYVGVEVSGPDGRTDPVWDGNDRWSIHPDMLVPLGDGGPPEYSVQRPRFVDDQAYVSGGVLVAHWPDALWMSGLTLAPRALNPVHDVVLTARLVRVGQAWELDDGMDDLRLATSEGLPFIARTATSSASMDPVCLYKSLYDSAKQRFCSYVDIAVDGGDPSSPCDAISGAATFTARPALIGDIAAPPPPLPPCAPDIHPETDACGSSSNP
jgi:hypothetical protein